MQQDLPLPQLRAFLVCSDILHDDRTQRFVLVNPFHYLSVEQFPLKLRASVFLQLQGGHGRNVLTFSLRNGEGDTVWESVSYEVGHHGPLFPHTVNLHDMLLDVPQRGRYDLVVFANGQEIGSQALWIGPSEFFTAG